MKQTYTNKSGQTFYTAFEDVLRSKTLQVLVLAGRRDAGKNTCQRHLETLGYEGVAFADEVRSIIEQVYGISGIRMKGLTVEDRVWRMQPHPQLGGASPVDAMKHIAAEFRSLDQNTWINALLRNISDRVELGLCQYLVVTDCRFRNQALEFLKRGAMLIYLDRSGSERVDLHKSEDLEGVEELAIAKITNDGSINDLHKKLDQTIAQLESKRSWSFYAGSLP